jgi:protein-S-isoprenylcysteine O-methyltransferase Ste14
MLRAFSVGGAALGIAAIVYCAWWYGVRLAAPVGPTDRLAAALTVNLAAFAIFAAHHSLFARSSAKALVARVASASLERPIYVWASGILLFALCGTWTRLGGTVYRVEGPGLAATAAVQLFGLWLWSSAARRISLAELIGVGRTREGRAFDAPDAGALSADGAYGLVRHPLYSGLLAVLWGVPHMTRDRLLFAVCCTAYILVAVRFEERDLEARHGARYRAYTRRVRARLVPGLL